MSTLLGIIWER